ncbi:MAG TPA: M17 family peptidase N-terminal domain-containing protein, partial [Isosphaeraceae bacterium]|nr:M17 family peptidase N-terminal domain-containing protein [Isosphaeraceae bacterium]
MRIDSILTSPASVQASWLILGVFEGKADEALVPLDSALGKRLAALFESKDLTGSVGETLAFYGGMEGYQSGSILVVGLGAREKWDGSAAFSAGLSAGKRLAAKPRGDVAVAVPAEGLSTLVASSLLEGLIVGTRSPGLKKSEV